MLSGKNIPVGTTINDIIFNPKAFISWHNGEALDYSPLYYYVNPLYVKSPHIHVTQVLLDLA